MGIVSQCAPDCVGGAFWKTQWDSWSESCDDGVPQGPVAWAAHGTKYHRQLPLHWPTPLFAYLSGLSCLLRCSQCPAM